MNSRNRTTKGIQAHAEERERALILSRQPNAHIRFISAHAGQMHTEVSNAVASLATFASSLQAIHADLNETSRAFALIERGDIGEIAADFGVKMSEVEDLDKFNGLVKAIAKMKSPQARIAACAKVLALLRESIDGWERKIDKLKRVTVSSGHTREEAANAILRSKDCQIVIDALRDRADVISQAHDAARKVLVNFLSKDAANFKPLYKSR